MMGVIRRIGIDICDIQRMATAVERSGDRFLSRCFTANELELAQRRPAWLAGRWAAKEAVIKCLHDTPLHFHRRQIEVLRADDGAPRLRLLGDDRGARIALTISHEAGVAVASASLELASPQPAFLPRSRHVRLPRRPPDGHKGTFGQVCVIAGSMDLTGAPYLSAMAAARTGAGTVKLFCARTIHPILAGRCVEVMVGALPEVEPGILGAVSRADAESRLGSATVGILGPGLGRAAETERLVQDLVGAVTVPLVVDADGLNALSARRELLPHLGAGGRVRVLTPHPGEMSRLLDRPTREIQGDREAVARRAAAEWGAVVVLKGAGTVVAAPDGRTATDPHSVPALATGGTGDVLSGVIGGLLAQGSPPFEAAVTGVWLHAATGARLQERLGSAGVVATDLLPLLPVVQRDLRAEDGEADG